MQDERMGQRSLDEHREFDHQRPFIGLMEHVVDEPDVYPKALFQGRLEREPLLAPRKPLRKRFGLFRGWWVFSHCASLRAVSRRTKGACGSSLRGPCRWVPQK